MRARRTFTTSQILQPTGTMCAPVQSCSLPPSSRSGSPSAAPPTPPCLPLPRALLSARTHSHSRDPSPSKPLFWPPRTYPCALPPPPLHNPRLSPTQPLACSPAQPPPPSPSSIRVPFHPECGTQPSSPSHAARSCEWISGSPFLHDLSDSLAAHSSVCFLLACLMLAHCFCLTPLCCCCCKLLGRNSTVCSESGTSVGLCQANCLTITQVTPLHFCTRTSSPHKLSSQIVTACSNAARRRSSWSSSHVHCFRLSTAYPTPVVQTLRYRFSQEYDT